MDGDIHADPAVFSSFWAQPPKGLAQVDVTVYEIGMPGPPSPWTKYCDLASCSPKLYERIFLDFSTGSLSSSRAFFEEETRLQSPSPQQASCGATRRRKVPFAGTWGTRLDSRTNAFILLPTTVIIIIIIIIIINTTATIITIIIICYYYYYYDCYCKRQTDLGGEGSGRAAQKARGSSPRKELCEGTARRTGEDSGHRLSTLLPLDFCPNF